MKIQIAEQGNSFEIVECERKIVYPSSAFGIIREHLVRNIGTKRAKSFLFHFGWEMGAHDGKEAMKSDAPLKELIKSGPLLHIENGQIRGFRHECQVDFDESQKVKNVLGQGAWLGSYEGEEHLKQSGVSDKPVCHTLIGYASGFMSTIFGQPLLAKELTCIAQGHDECQWVVKTKEEWAHDMPEELDLYNETPIVNELKYTYDQLLEQKNFITQLSDFQKNMTEEVINGQYLQKIVDMMYETMQIPVIVESIDARTIVHSGLSEEQYLELKEDMDQYIDQYMSKELLQFRKKMIQTNRQKRLLTPVLVQREILGWCSLIYEAEDGYSRQEKDYLFLDRFANAVSLVLLNEKTKFESFERMKGNFLEEILEGKFTADEIIKRGRYAGLNLAQPYYIAVLSYKKKNCSIEEDYLFQEQFYEASFSYFHDKKQTILAGHRDQKIVCFIPKKAVSSSIEEDMNDFYHFLNKKYPQEHFKIGISNLADNPSNAFKSYEEALVALRLTTKKPVVPFRSLGIIGILINSQNINSIRSVAKQELGSLYNIEDPKAVELLKTLYFFLLNGGKLEQTMSDLALSMSGLRHRIQKIEGILDKDLRDSNEAHQLLLLIKSLIVTDELPIL
ncbi:V4R domain-containing protein [Peribacillus asahii]|uniref:V4R domain-containing protein n=1 Tax=Peribacillus asahii TaxID=228899 RepID=UPI00207ACFD6|nr:V4R domain-containing protein [Peribacillus asahii]USK69938.1 XylR N-terminal domain-containing protein [Peribacillus asahii]